MVASAQNFFDNQTQTPYLVSNGNQWFSYENVQSLQVKVLLNRLFIARLLPSFLNVKRQIQG